MSARPPLRGVCVGAGYFSRFQYEAWQRLADVTIVANCNRSLERAQAMATEFDIPKSYGIAAFEDMLDAERPDFVDIITPPETHLSLVRACLERGITTICQKPLTPTWDETLELVQMVQDSTARFMVHENWRWQPWYRELKRQLQAGTIGNPFQLSVHCRLGDGWGDDAYLERQPFFRDYPRLFLFETGVHFLDTFRFLFGEVSSIFAHTAQHNPVIKGEDASLVHCTHANGTTSLLDANRYNESDAKNPRFTFGTVRLEGSDGHLELASDGSITLKALGKSAIRLPFEPATTGFAGDCVYALQKHFTEAMLNGTPFENTATDYIKSVQLVELAYASASAGQSQIVSPLTES